MGRQNKYFELENNVVESDLSNWIMLMIYAKNINKEQFNILNNISYGKGWDDDSDEISYDESKIKSSINFIDDLINKLKGEEEELYIRYPEEVLIRITNTDKEEDFPAIDEGNNLLYDNQKNIKWLENLKNNILIKSLESKKPYSVYVM